MATAVVEDAADHGEDAVRVVLGPGVALGHARTAAAPTVVAAVVADLA